MASIAPPNDSSFLLRFFHIPYIIQMVKLIRCDPNTKPVYPSPRFEVFQPLPKQKDQKDSKQTLLRRLIKTFRKDIIVCLLITLLWTCLNLLLPTIIKEFYSLMKLQTMQQAHINKATYITQKFIILQLIRSFISGHLTRACYQLSLKVESTLSAELTSKALRINSECRSKLPESEVYHLQSVDLKLIGKMFKHVWMVLDIPLTLTVAIILLFLESTTFGLVGMYWIVIMFFLQSWLSDQLARCNRNKKMLIEERSRFNFEAIQKIKEARLGHAQTILLQKNNDFFLKENEDHLEFFHYHSLFEITLLLLPIIVALSISLYDHGEQISFTIKEVYMLLTLLGLCYRPLKNIKSMSLHVQDGLHSLSRIRVYLELPEVVGSPPNSITNNQSIQPHLTVKKYTMTMERKMADNKVVTTSGFYCDRNIELRKGERLVVLGKKGQGVTNLLRSVLDEIYTVNGSIKLEGTVAYLPQVNFFCLENIRYNISFYDQNITEEQLRQAYSLLGLKEDLKFRKGLDEIVQTAKFSQAQLKKIGLARVICSNRQIYIMDCPYLGLGVEVAERLEKVLRDKQKNGNMIIMAQNYLRFADENDKILILQGGQIKEFGRYGDMINQVDSHIHNFRLAQKLALSDRISYLPVVKEFQQKIKKILILQTLKQEKDKKKEETIILNRLLLGVGRYSLKLKSQNEIKKQGLKKTQKSQDFLAYFSYFISELPITQWFFGVLIILSIELLHVFIQYQIGQQYKKGGIAAVGSFKMLMRYELVLTCGLAFLMYFEYHILCKVSTIVGNKIYEKAITSVSKKPMKWYTLTHAPFISDKLNHDYEQIYTIIKNVFDIFKYIIVFITTLLLIEASFNIIAVITTIIVLYYYIMLRLIRRSEQTIIRSHSIYKHNFVKVFDEIIEGGFIINVFGKTKQAFNKAKKGFISNASYKQVINSSVIVEDMIGELTSGLIIALALEYGTIIKIKEGEQNQALVAVSVMLLFNLSEVFKNLMKTIIKLQSFFRLKLISYVELINIDKKNTDKKEEEHANLLRYNIQFKEILIQEKDDPIFEIYPFTLSIAQEQKIVLFQQDNNIRNNILLALTSNLQNFSMGRFNTDVIKIGGVNINTITKQQMIGFMSVILPDNFFFAGTLQQNLKWKNPNYDQKMAMQLAERLNLRKEVPQFQVQGLKANIVHSQNQRQLSRKIAFIRAILKKSRIIIIKDTPWYFGGVNIIDILKEAKHSCTIIGITNDLTGMVGAQRFVYLDKLKIIQDDRVENLQKDELSLSGALLRSLKTQPQYLQVKKSADLDEVLRTPFTRSLAQSMIEMSSHGNSQIKDEQK